MLRSVSEPSAILLLCDPIVTTPPRRTPGYIRQHDSDGAATPVPLVRIPEDLPSIETYGTDTSH